MRWFIGPTNTKKENIVLVFRPVFSKLALMHTVYEGIFNVEKRVFSIAGNGMLVQHCLSSLVFALFAYPATATIYAESTTLLRNQ
jgi:hypothetical protein